MTDRKPATPSVMAEEMLPETEGLEADQPLDNAVPENSAEMTALRERDEWRDKAYRATAEMENAKRRAAQDVQDARQYAVSKFAADVLGVADNLARALSAPEGNEKALRDGVAMTAAQFQSTLARHGVAMIPVKAGDALNPDLHQAMSEAASDFKPGTIVQELQPGFTISGRLLRPALVVVAKGSE